MLLSTFSFAVMNVLIKKVSNIPPMEVVFFRCAVSMLLCFQIIFRDKLDWKGNSRLLLILRGLLLEHLRYILLLLPCTAACRSEQP